MCCVCPAISDSLCHLCVLCVSVVVVSFIPITTESQRTRRLQRESLSAEEQLADLIRQLVISHDMNLSLIESSNGVEPAVNEIE